MQPSTYKLILVGESNTGKTSIINRYVNNDFSDNFSSTIGVEFMHKELDDSTKLSIWDTAGQERFQSLSSSLYRNADIIMFVYDVSIYESFTLLENWYRQYISFGESDAIKLLIGNKIDLKQNVPVEIAKSWAVEKNMFYETVSAKDSDNVNNAFSVAIKQLNRLPRVHKEKIELINKPKSDRCCY